MSDSVTKWFESQEDAFNDVKLNHEPNQRKEQPVYSGVLKYFPNAIKYVSVVSKKGNDQHHPDKPLHWDKSKSTDEPDALVRHLLTIPLIQLMMMGYIISEK